MKKKLFLLIGSIFTLSVLSAQGTINHPLANQNNAESSGKIIKYKGHRNYSFTERSDLRLYLNGRYIGLQSKQVDAFIIPYQGDKGLIYEGNFYINQDTTRNKMQVENGLHNSIPSEFIISDDGNLTMLNDNGYPSFRSFPAYSAHNIKIGDRWEAKATRAVDPLSKGIVTKMPIYVQYTYTGDDYLNGEAVYLITAQWATRYGMNSTSHFIDFGGDKELEKAQGSHKATIIVSKASGAALVIRDMVDETFYYSDGNSYQFKGTISLFTEYPPAVDRSKLIDAIKRIIELDDDEAEELKKVKEPEEDRAKLAAYESSEDLKSESLQKEELASITEPNIKEENDDDWEKISDDYLDLARSPKKEKSVKEKVNEKITEKINEDNKASNKSAKASAKKSGKNADKNTGKNENKITVDNTEAGIRLTMQNLQFKADSSELLAGEEIRLSQIAEILKVAEGANFLIEGHTASTGYEEGEMKLSLERAESIAKALSQKGIDSSRFICKGSGGKKPVADNKSPEGKARNRRVEITILE
ncbi:MAG: OmpA family protein [Treponema sp.]|nr:OmpA family protein [Treponema sp.]